MRIIVVRILGDLDVQSFYQNCEVLVTRATGFLGKLTVEKVLRSCPGRQESAPASTDRERTIRGTEVKVLWDNVVKAASRKAVICQQLQ
ncbi:hypothetical protein PR048_022906 [Dryococelus australis]|uniref:Thioester reductase (TE) domain-containing protein n=1 Tax=Dryococelus australis TaxID=614101 RepID=A0ABQ9GSN5_9NEOP|nr:hypothetical protein PR048_022906 [Dryococelus australis]